MIGKFKIDGAYAHVVTFEHQCSSTIDPVNGQPTNAVKIELLKLQLRSIDARMRGKLAKWMSEKKRIQKIKKIEIEFFEDESDEKPFKTLLSERAVIVFYKEEFSVLTPDFIALETIFITVEKLDITVEGGDSSSFIQPWPNS